jgi:hypothetical protein
LEIETVNFWGAPSGTEGVIGDTVGNIAVDPPPNWDF